MQLTTSDFATYKILLQVCVKYQVDVQYDEFFDNLLVNYKGIMNADNLSNWLDEQIPKLFQAVGERPKWIQSAEWLFDTNKEPMIFLGQVDVNINQNSEIPKIFHDDTTIYLFMPKGGGEIEFIIQQY